MKKQYIIKMAVAVSVIFILVYCLPRFILALVLTMVGWYSLIRRSRFFERVKENSQND